MNITCTFLITERRDIAEVVRELLFQRKQRKVEQLSKMTQPTAGLLRSKRLKGAK
jgi:hypothetical protein